MPRIIESIATFDVTPGELFEIYLDPRRHSEASNAVWRGRQGSWFSSRLPRVRTRLDCPSTNPCGFLNAYHVRDVLSFFRPAVARLQRTCSGPL